VNEGLTIPLSYVALETMIESASTQGAFDGFRGLLVETLLEKCAHLCHIRVFSEACAEH
jgi:hypothetical protein